MVRAILAGQKTQTRRLIKAPAPTVAGAFRIDTGFKGGHLVMVESKPSAGDVREILWLRRCPYGQPGDRLYVRHAFNLFPVYFKPIPGWEGFYAAGTDGLIYRMDRREPEALQGSPSNRGYLTVSLSRGETP